MVNGLSICQFVQELVSIEIYRLPAISQLDFTNYAVLIDNIDDYSSHRCIQLIQYSHYAKIRIIQKVFVNFHQLIRLVNNNSSSYHVCYSEWIISFNFILTNFLSYSPQVLFHSSKYLEICIFHHILNSQMEIIICLECVLIQEVRFVKITS